MNDRRRWPLPDRSARMTPHSGDGVAIPAELPAAIFVEEFESPYAIRDE